LSCSAQVEHPVITDGAAARHFSRLLDRPPARTMTIAVSAFHRK
jgi:hypothetical protein